LALAWANAGKSSAAKMAMMAITTSNSISVKAGRRPRRLKTINFALTAPVYQ
jgi:hypothetical protein